MTAAAAWTAGGLWDHGRAALAVFGLGFRRGALSTLSAAGLIVAQAAAACARRSRCARC